MQGPLFKEKSAPPPVSKRRIAATAAALLLMTGLWLPGGVLLCLTPVRGGPPLVCLWLDPDERFTLRYNHSVEQAPIWETHSVNARGRIFIEEERYLKLGAGMGQMPGVGRMMRDGPYEAITDMHWPTGDFILRIGSEAVDHTLTWRDQNIRLSAMAPHVAVQFTARPIHLLRRWYLQYLQSEPLDEK